MSTKEARPYGFLLAEDTHRRLKVYAALVGASMSALVERAVLDLLQREAPVAQELSD